VTEAGSECRGPAPAGETGDFAAMRATVPHAFAKRTSTDGGTTTRDSLAALANSTGVICTLALDHRDAMRNVFKRAGIDDPTEDAMARTKVQIVEVLASSASSIMLDPAAVARCRPRGSALVVPLEAQGYQAVAGGRLTHLMDDFGPTEAAALGADGCKLLLYYRADHAPTTSCQRELVDRVAARCHENGLPLVLEPLVYRLDAEAEADYRGAFADLVVAAARELADSGADLLKLQFPGDVLSCARVSEAAAPLHWALLGGTDVEGDEFTAQLETACRAGACGFIAGRSIWGRAVGQPADEQDEWLRRNAVPLFERLVDIANEHGRRIR
jgi:tagatose 1,6-diphosphate aldolase